MARWRRGPGRDRQGPATVWALDLETTGLDPDRDRIIEVGVVPVVDRRIQLGRAWSALVRPDEYRAAGTPAHGIMPVDLADALAPEVLVDELSARIGPGPLLVHHARLDVAFLRALHRRLERPWPGWDVVDTVELLDRRNRRLRQLGQPELPLQLAAARAAVGLPPADEHRALADAVATAELWLALTSPAPPTARGGGGARWRGGATPG